MKHKPLISIITVCFNSEKHISGTFDSVLKQDYKNIEHIVVDGSSTDSTLDIIKEYEKEYNGRLKWVSEPDTGIYNALNKGIALANGEIIGILHSDDWYCADAMNVLMENYEENIDIYYGDIYKIREINNEKYQKRINGHGLSNIRKKMSIPHPSCFVSKGWYGFLRYDDKYKISADYKFILESYLKNAKFKYINHAITCMRMGGASSGGYANIIEGYRIRKEIFKKKDIHKLMYRLILFFVLKARKVIALKLLPSKTINRLELKDWEVV